MGARDARDVNVMEYLVAALMIAGADTGRVGSQERIVSIYATGRINHVNYSKAGIIPANYSKAGIIPVNYAPRDIKRYGIELPAPDRWFGEDKFQHFALSYMITVGAFSTARFVTGHNESMLIGAGVGLGAGIAKELYDRKTNRAASVRDLLWDVAGIATGMFIAAQTR